MAACVALACGPLAVALLTESRWADEDSRVIFLLAFGLALATGAVLLLRAGDARAAREAAAPERALRQARDQQAATAEILTAIAASPPDLQRVFDTIARNATRVSDGSLAAVTRFDGQLIHLVAHHDLSSGALDVLHRQFPCPPDDTSLAGRAIRRAELVHVVDASRDPRMPELSRETARAQGYTSAVVVPLLRDGRALGALTVARLEGGFSERQIQLLQTFAGQAVIAVENTRLFQELEARNRELTEALERETVTAGILRVISSSPTDVHPVFDTIVKNVLRLCDAVYSAVFQVDGDRIDLVAHHNIPAAGLAELRSRYPAPLSVETGSAQAARERVVVQISDVETDSTVSEDRRRLARIVGYRSQAWVPMLKGDGTLGVIAVSRREAEPFPPQHIALLQTFADQAVIAVENVRLFQELQARNQELARALEREQATGEVLRVIGGSPTSVEPVFDAILTSAMRLCDTPVGLLFLYDGDGFRLIADRGAVPAFVEPRRMAFRPGPHTGLARAAHERRPVQIPDMMADIAYAEGDASRLATVELLGARTGVWVPMLREGAPVGVICTWRREVRAFTDSQVDLLAMFAAQAVIAMENARLFQELQARNRDLTEALEQQTATSEILQAISASPTDLAPVFDTILRSAVQLCAGFYSLLFLLDGERLDLSATHNVPPEGLEALRRRYPLSITSDEGGLTARAVRERRLLHVRDVQNDPRVPVGSRLASGAVGQRAAVAVPLFREGEPVGALTVSRQEARDFSAKELALLQTFAAQAVIAIENVRLFRELQARNRDLTEALEQQTATADILKVISRSPTDVQPVFEAIAESAGRLTNAVFGGTFLVADGMLQLAAIHTPDGRNDAFRRMYPIPLDANSLATRVAREGIVVNISDAEIEPSLPEPQRKRVLTLGARSLLIVPMVRDAQVIGMVIAGRREPGAFTAKQVTLLQTFAAQAVIAIENVRLFQELQARNRELTEALEQQTATAEILRVISSSPTDVQPVFDTIVDSVVRLCDGVYTTAFRFDGELIYPVAYHRSLGPEGQGVHQRMYPRPPSRDSIVARAILERTVIHVADAERDPDVPPDTRELARVVGYQSILAVPMLREGNPIGALGIGRRELNGRVRPFLDREIALIRTFADQAVIAIENVRLFTELGARNRDLTESLEQQTATAEILRVISSSPTDVQPVFEAIAASARRLCEAHSGAVLRFDGSLIHLAAYIGVPDELEAVRRVFPIPPGRGSVTARAILTRAVVHVNIAEDPEYEHTVLVRGGLHTVLSVPMLREGNPIGAITVSREEGRPFTDKQIALLQTFADQAVIAVENVRLFTELGARNRELTEALEQQTATAEILRVISSSPTDLRPVFGTIVRNATRICEGLFGAVYQYDGERVHFVAHENFTGRGLQLVERGFPASPSRDSMIGRAILDASMIHVPDLEADEDVPPWSREVGRALNYRSLLIVPMLREGKPIGAIAVSRGQSAFSERQINVVKTFADQAVIAIENVRLFQELEARNRELTEALEQQTATAEILGVISRSPTDLQPVLEAVVTNASRLCGADNASLYRVEGSLMRKVAEQGSPLTMLRVGESRPITRTSISGRAMIDRISIHVTDHQSAEAVREYPDSRRDTGIRTTIGIPLLREGVAIGAFTAYRTESRPFSGREIALLQTFADQAVIAIENVRLFQELQARNRELTEALEQQTATSEILRAISSSPTDSEPVFGTIAQHAVRICDARHCVVLRFDGALIHMVAHYGLSPAALHEFEQAYPLPMGGDTMSARAIRDRSVVHSPDILCDPENSELVRRIARAGGYRSGIVVPMLRSGSAIGAIAVSRSTADGEPRPFSDKEIALLQTFADQGVIAIENVRLFQELEARNRELTESLEQQTATAEILRVISSSPTDVQPVFDSILERAIRLADGVFGAAFSYDGELVHLVAHHGLSDEALALNRRVYPMAPGPGQLTALAVLEKRVVHLRDVDRDPDVPEMTREYARVMGFRSLLAVPMLREDRLVGVLTITRAAGEFSTRQIELVKIFADQAVIAIENVRLFQELQARNRDLTEALEQQTATAEILRVISRSPTDTQPVFNAIVASAVRLCDGRIGALYRIGGDTIDVLAFANPDEEARRTHDTAYPRPLADLEPPMQRLALDATPVHLVDVDTDPGLSDTYRERARILGFRTGVVVPMIREGRTIGAVSVGRAGPGRTPRPFADREIGLLQVFADQAVIAIENVRLFNELDARNRELTESLEQQTATAEILRAISSSPTDTQPVFDTIAQRAARVCDGMYSAVLRFDGSVIDLVAHTGMTPAALEEYGRVYPLPPTGETLAARAIREGVVVHSPDAMQHPSAVVRRIAQVGGHRSAVVVPMLRMGRAVGAIAVARSDPAGGPRPFTEKEIALLQTFADQGVIAVENVRLFRELETRTRELARSVEELQALSEVGRAVSSTLDLPTVLATIVARAVQLSRTSGGVLYEYEEATQSFHLRASHQTETEVVEALRASPIQLGEGATGQAVVRRAPVEVADILEDQQFGRVRAILTRLGYRSILSIPLLLEQRILGALTVSRREPGSFPPETVNLLQAFATQSALAIQNARLFREIEAKGRELEIASRHKSQFLANMSHELRTPLNAILGYTELMNDGIYGDLPQKAGDVMTRIDRSGKHLLGLINDVLDLSKIEAGQLELTLADYALVEVVNAVLTQVESLAAEKGLLLQAAVAPALLVGRGDERRLAQVLLNLVGNAIKFTEVGSVRIGAHQDGEAFVVSVADTGPGIPEADRQRIFEEFQQADSSSTRKKGGTGLGLSIARRIVELHGGRIWVESTVGRGSTFSFRVPVRVERQAARA